MEDEELRTILTVAEAPEAVNQNEVSKINQEDEQLKNNDNIKTVNQSRDISEEVNCPLCLDILQDPCFLPCMHTFCRECVYDHVSMTEQQSPQLNGSRTEVKCPTCRCPSYLSRDDVKLLKKNYLIANIIEKIAIKNNDQPEIQNFSLRKVDDSEKAPKKKFQVSAVEALFVTSSNNPTAFQQHEIQHRQSQQSQPPQQQQPQQQQQRRQQQPQIEEWDRDKHFSVSSFLSLFINNIIGYHTLLCIPQWVILGIGWNTNCSPSHIQIFLLVCSLVCFPQIYLSIYVSMTDSPNTFKNMKLHSKVSCFSTVLFIGVIELFLCAWGIYELAVLDKCIACVTTDPLYDACYVSSITKHLRNMGISTVVIMAIGALYSLWLSYMAPKWSFEKDQRTRTV